MVTPIWTRRIATQVRPAVQTAATTIARLPTPARAAAALGAAGAVAVAATMARPPQPQPAQQPQVRVIVETRGPSRAEQEFWESYYRTQQLQRQREAMLKTIREQAAQWQQQYEAHRAAQERAWAEYQRVLAQTGSQQAAIAAYKAAMASAPPPPPPQPITSLITGRAGVSPQPQQAQPPQTQPQLAPTWAAIGAGAAGLAAAAALARRPSGIARPVAEAAARRPTVTPFHTPLRPQPQPPRIVQPPRPQPPQPTPSVAQAAAAGAAQRAAMQASSRAARQVQAAAAARNITQQATRSANLGKLARFAKYGAGIGALGLIGYGIYAMATSPEAQATQQQAGGAGAGAPAPSGAGAGAPGGVGGVGGTQPVVGGAGVGVGAPQGPICDALGRPIRPTSSAVGAMGMAPEVDYGAGVLGGVGEAGAGVGGEQMAQALPVGAGVSPLLVLLGLGGAAVVALLLLSRKK